MYERNRKSAEFWKCDAHRTQYFKVFVHIPPRFPIQIIQKTSFFYNHPERGSDFY